METIERRKKWIREQQAGADELAGEMGPDLLREMGDDDLAKCWDASRRVWAVSAESRDEEGFHGCNEDGAHPRDCDERCAVWIDEVTYIGRAEISADDPRLEPRVTAWLAGDRVRS